MQRVSILTDCFLARSYAMNKKVVSVVQVACERSFKEDCRDVGLVVGKPATTLLCNDLPAGQFGVFSFRLGVMAEQRKTKAQQMQ